MLLFNSKATQKWQKINLILKEISKKKENKGERRQNNKKDNSIFMPKKYIFIKKDCKKTVKMIK